MAGFGIAGLAFGKTDRFAVGDELGANVSSPERLDAGSLGQGHGISGTGWGNAPAVDDD